jgi:hypothetical protein
VDLKEVFLDVVRQWQRDNVPVSEPIREVFIEPDPFQRPDLKSPIPGSRAT